MEFKNANNQDPNSLRMKYLEGELQGLRRVLAYLTDGNMQAFAVLMFIKENYKEWDAMLSWLKNNKLCGQKLVEFFQNESPDGGGYLLGCTKIISRMEGKKYHERNVKIDDLS